MTSRRLLAFVVRTVCVALAVCLASACSGEASKPAETNPAKTKLALTPNSAPKVDTTKLNLDEIIPAGRGRELLLDNCTTCHTFVPIVVLQMNKESWEANKTNHRERIPEVTDADFEFLYQYLIASFNPEKPVPTLPPELLATWTSY